VAALPGNGRAAVDLMAKVNVELVARPAAASGADQDFTVRDGGVLRSGDGVQLRLRADADAYIYVIAYGSSGSAMLLHPFSEKPGDALIRQGQTEVVPESGVFLPLDDNEGRETLFTVVSEAPLDDIADLLSRLEADGGDLNAATNTIRVAYPHAGRLSFKHIGARPLVGVAATTPRTSPTQSSAGTVATDAGTGADSESLSPPAGGSWSVSSSQGFGTSESSASSSASSDRAEPASGAGSAAAVAAASAASSTRDGAPEAAAAAAPESGDAREVSPALRKAREAAGIDEDQFRGILASLPGSEQVAVPQSFRKPSAEQGVLSAEGSRIRALDSVQLESEQGWPRDDAEAPTKLQN
jgi:hypothetical protein